MFISSSHILHVEPSYDPIFYANEPRYYKGLRKPYYYNSDARARPLACVDTSELCSPDGKTCWDMRSPVPNGTPSTRAYWLMKWSLENSNTYKTIKWRLGEALLAQRKVSQYLSRPLPPNQWELEASQLFATSLARIQYDTWAIATGEDHDKPEYVEITPNEAKGRLCGIYKFKTLDYINVNLVAFIGYMLLAIAIWISSWEVTIPRWARKREPNSATGSQTPLKLLIEAILICLGMAVVYAFYFLISLPGYLRDWWKDRKKSP